MAEDAVDHGIVLGGLEPRECITKELNIHGFHTHPERFGELSAYGSDAPAVEALIRSDPDLAEPLHPRLRPKVGEVVWAVREEMARTVDDVLARRTRSLVLDARAAVETAPKVAAIMAKELHRDRPWEKTQVESFTELARAYFLE
jgi:glycerol-3-phosphate dehydrogenase